MSTGAPPVDPRTAALIAADVAAKLRANVPEWSPSDPATGVPDQASAALISIVSRFGELVIERLNQAPDKNRLAFLDMLGTAPLPPSPARVPLTFTTVAGSTADGVVPAGTQVASSPAEGEDTPVVFETERELTAIAATVRALIAVDAERDLIADHGDVLAGPAPLGVHVFSGDRPNEHVVYVAHSALLSNAQLSSLSVTVQPTSDSPAAPDARAVQWEIWDGASGVQLTVADATQALRVAGDVEVTGLAQVPEQIVNGVRNRWLRCRLLTPVSPGLSAGQGMVRAAQLPVLAGLHLSATINRASLAPDAAFTNASPVDVSRPFFPFGETPKLGDAFYIGQREALGQPGAAITIDVALVNPIPDTGPATSSVSTTAPSGDLQLKWEVWSGTAWALLGTTTPTNGPSPSFTDDGKAFTKSKPVTFTLPSSLAPTSINGVTSNWIRVSIVAGNYGVEAQFTPDISKPGGFALTLATFAPPMVSALSVSYAVTTLPSEPDAVVAFNNGQFEDLTQALAAGRATPFTGLPAQAPALYTAFELAPGRSAFPNRTVTLYHGVRLPPYGERQTPLSPERDVLTATPGATTTHRFTLTNASAESVRFLLATFGGAWASSVSPADVTLLPGLATEIAVTVTVPPSNVLGGPDASDRGFLTVVLPSSAVVHSVVFETRVGAASARRRELRFEYWNGASWAKLVATDGTDLLTHPGLVEFLGPADFAPSMQFGVLGYWMRALMEPGDDAAPQLRTLLLNTTFAAQTVTFANEILGSSDASAGQTFRATQSPVLSGPRLEVREPSPPSPDELVVLGPSDEVLTLVPASGEVWVRWTEVSDFHGSGPNDRHYVLDHLAGEVRFGDGIEGRLPPRGVGNIRFAQYQTGGGDAGNRAAGTIVQLKTTVPYIDGVVNVEAAEGGAEAEPTSSVLARSARALRHGGRAVAHEDFEDLARSASPEVARAKTVPLRDLRVDPLNSTPAAGAVSVLIVPRSTEAKPLPSAGLMAEVEDALRSVATPTASITVVGPLYVRVDVTIEVALVSLEGASAVEDAVRSALRGFLHPLTGGRDGAGWDFGRQPFLSDLYAVVSDVPGVDHVRSLRIDQIEEPSGALGTGRFLVYSGQHQITLTFVGAE